MHTIDYPYVVENLSQPTYGCVHLLRERKRRMNNPQILEFKNMVRCPFSITSPLLSKCLFLLACSAGLGNVTGSETIACGDGGICDCFCTGTTSYEVNCSSRNLDTFPKNIPTNVTKLILSDNRFQEIPDNVLQNSTLLKFFDISHNNLKEIPQEFFWKTKHLTKLYLSHNFLENLQSCLFERTWYLETLNVANNLLHQIPHNLLLNMTKLETLDMSNNSLKEVPKDIFKKNRLLRKVSLSSNAIDELPASVFENIGELNSIQMSSNNLTQITKYTFVTNVKLRQLNLSYNNIMDISPKGFVNNELLEEIYLDHNNLTSIPKELLKNNQMIRVLDLSYNNLMSISHGTFESNTKMRALDLSNNVLQHLNVGVYKKTKKLKSLLLSNNKLEKLPEGLFDNLEDVLLIDLSHNHLKQLPRHIFAKNGKLNLLILSHNMIEEIPDNLLKNNSLLKTVRLSYNNLTILPGKMFGYSSNMMYLKLDHNSLESISENIFDNNSALKNLDLSNNLLTELPIGVFRKNQKIETLDISSNNLKKLPSDLFCGNSKLKTVKLSNNRLEELPDDLFKNMSKLGYLSLSHNCLKSLPADLFKANVLLKEVTLSYNSLTDVPEGLFITNAILRYVSFTRSNLRAVPEGIFWNNTLMEEIDFTGNILKRLPDRLLLSLTNLRTLRLGSNNLEALPENLFASVDGLKNYAICKNKFISIDKKVFNGSTSLTYLNMYGNKVSFLPKDVFSDVSLNGIADISDNEISEIPERLFCSNKMCAHNLTWLLLNNNNLVYLHQESFIGLHKLTHIFLHGNKIKELGENIFSGTGIEYIYMFSNNITEISNTSFRSGSLREVQLYKNDIRYMTADAFNIRGSHIHVYIHCYSLAEIPLLNLNLTATCVTSGIIPKIKLTGMYKIIAANLIEDGFNCTMNENVPECSPCPPGTFGDGHNGCQSCPAGGFYQDDFGHLNCKACPAGVFVNHSGGTSNADCALCPEGTDLTRHAGHRACFCKIKYARINRFEGCSLCLERGLNCSKDYKSLQPGFYWNWSFPGADVTEYSNFVYYLENDSLLYNYSNRQYRFEIPKVHQCPQPLSCENKDSFKAGRIQGNCKDGYQGWLCSKCQEGFYSVLNTCIPCPDKKWIFLEMIAILLFGAGSYAFIYWQNKKQEDSNRRQRSLVDKISSQTKIVLGFYQVVGELFESFHDVTWVGPLAFVGQVIAFLKVKVLRVIIRPHCYSENLHMNAKVQFIISLSFPIAIFVVLVFLYQFWRLYLKYRVRATIDCRIAKLKKLKEKLCTYALILLFVTYPPTCDVVFKLYPGACKTFYIYENKTTVNITLLRSDFDLECSTLKIYQIFAYIATGIYVIAFPCVLLFLLGKYFRKNATTVLLADNADSTPNTALDERSVLIKDNCDQVIIPVWLKFLSENYKPQFWYWEIIELTRKVTQTVLVTLLGWEDALTKLLTIGTSVLFLTLHAKLSPMTSQFEQRLQMFSLTAIFINVLVASVPIPHDYAATISTVLILMNMIIVVVIVGEVTIFIVRFLRPKLRQRKMQNTGNVNS